MNFGCRTAKTIFDKILVVPMFRKSMSGIKKKREPKECSTTTCMSQKLKTAKFFDEQQKRPKKYIAFTVDCCLTGQTFQRY